MMEMETILEIEEGESMEIKLQGEVMQRQKQEGEEEGQVSDSANGITSSEPAALMVEVETKLLEVNLASPGPPPLPVNESTMKEPKQGEELKEIESSLDQACASFDEMKLNPILLQGIYEYGFQTPTAIQDKAIISCLSGRDVIIQAHSGTGKTVTALIAVLQKLDPENSDCQALILANTHEMAKQIQKLIFALGKYMYVTCEVCVGGTSVTKDKWKLQNRGGQIVVGTPGRIYDMISKCALLTNEIKTFVLDEADKMLAWKFKEQSLKIFQCMHMNKDTQVILLSEEFLPKAVKEVAKELVRDPVIILVKQKMKDVKSTFEGIKQFYEHVEDEEKKPDKLSDLLHKLSVTRAVIFCNSRKMVDFLVRRLQFKQHSVLCMHGGMVQKDRDVIVKRFWCGTGRALITTDLLAGSGIDLQQVPLVINYELPSKRENYIQRIGRFGHAGVVINFVVAEENTSFLKDIEKLYKTEIVAIPSNVADMFKQFPES